MKNQSERNKTMGDFPKFYGKVPVGTKGQIVIPAEARKAMKINPGDNLILISGPPHQEQTISIISEEEFSRFLEKAARVISRMEEELPKKSK